MKVYEKPALFAESFTLTEHIADRCALDYTPDTHMQNGTPHHANSGECAFAINNGSVLLFNSNTVGNPCTLAYDLIPGNTVKIECYNNFESFSNLFSS